MGGNTTGMQQNQMTREDFGRHYENEHGRTVGFLLSKGFPEDEARETAQAAWVRGWERRAQIREPKKTVSWVNTIALNMGRTRFYKRSRMVEVKEDMPARPSSNVSAVIDAQRLLAGCRQRDRELLEKRYLRELDIGDLARESSCSRRAIRIRLHRARRYALRQAEQNAHNLSPRCQPRTASAAG
jgi:RNA polymerase sigma-70 factor (ECF subfamily)